MSLFVVIWCYPGSPCLKLKLTHPPAWWTTEKIETGPAEKKITVFRGRTVNLAWPKVRLLASTKHNPIKMKIGERDNKREVHRPLLTLQDTRGKRRIIRIHDCTVLSWFSWSKTPQLVWCPDFKSALGAGKVTRWNTNTNTKIQKLDPNKRASCPF